MISTGAGGTVRVEPGDADATLHRLIREALPKACAVRHDLHRHPELAMHEHATSQRIQAELASIGIPFKAGLARDTLNGAAIGGTGIVAHLAASTPEGNALPAIGLRADIDALPILESTGKPYASATPGVMHACGHDGHTAILLGAARVLAAMPNRPRPVTFIFQPAEEDIGGAELLCNEGALKGGTLHEDSAGLGTPVGEVFGLHGWPQLPVGCIASRVGPLLAAVDDFEITITGTQAHAAYPHLGRDPIVATAAIITALQAIASRAIGPLDSVVVTVGQVRAGSAKNIIPGTAFFEGTVRTLRAATRAAARERLHEIVTSTARAHGCEAKIDYIEGYPVTENEPAATEKFFRIAEDAIGPSRVLRVEQPTMGGEDFAFYGRHAPACFFFLGLRPAGAVECPSLHQPDFDFNDDALPLGIEMFCRLALTR
jgi:hippurate hydrolase